MHSVFSLTWQLHLTVRCRSWKPDRLRTFPPFKQTPIHNLSVGMYEAVKGKNGHSFLGRSAIFIQTCFLFPYAVNYVQYATSWTRVLTEEQMIFQLV